MAEKRGQRATPDLIRWDANDTGQSSEAPLSCSANDFRPRPERLSVSPERTSNLVT